MTDLEAANRALVLIGVEVIGSLNDNGKAARVMNGMMDASKRAVLNEFPWTFATRIVPLTKGGSVAGYSYSFAKPSDALSIRRVYGNDAFRGLAEFRVVGNYIGANISSGSVEYTAYVSDLEQWPQHIAECLVTRLAADTAVTLTGDGNLGSALLNKYAAMASHAAQVSVTEENVPPLRMADYRGGYADAR